MNCNYKEYYNKSRNLYKKEYLDLIFFFDKDIDYLNLEITIFSEKELEKY